MLSAKSLNKMFQGRLEEARTSNQSRASGLLAGLREFHDTLGLHTNDRGVPVIEKDERGMPVLKANRAQASEVSLRLLAEAIMGREFTEEYFNPSGGFDFGLLREAALDPSAFQNINTFNLATAGLINAEIMDRFNQPEFFGRNIVTIKPTKMNGQKLIAVARMPTMTKASKGRLPGEAHAETGFGEAYQTTPETVEQAAKCVVTKEAVFYDLTGQVLEEAGMVGHELAYQQEIDIADTVLGVTNSYNRNGTATSTYQTTSPWINDFSNPFADAQDIDDARQLFVGMTDPESGKEIQVIGNTILCMPAKELLMRHQVFAPQMQYGSQAAGNFPSVWSNSSNLLDGRTGPWTGAYTIINVGPIWYNRAIAGIDVAANVTKYWYIGDFNKAFWWMENWGFTPWQASADELVMKDRGLVAVYGANYRGVAYVREPRYVVRSKN